MCIDELFEQMRMVFWVFILHIYDKRFFLQYVLQCIKRFHLSKYDFPFPYIELESISDSCQNVRILICSRSLTQS